MSKKRPIEYGYQGDHFEAAETETKYARRVGKGSTVGALGAGAVAGLVTGNPFVGAGVAAAVKGVGWAGGQLARNAADDHLAEAAKEIDEDPNNPLNQ